MIISPSISAGFVNSYKSFPYLPRSIRDNNLLSPYNEFIDLPINEGIARWTEEPPLNWSQYGPYYNLFLKYYLKADGDDEDVPNGGGRIHSLKAASLGSSLSLSKERNVTTSLIVGGAADNKDWSLSQITYTVPITTQTYVNFGCLYKVLQQDFLRPLNFGGVAVFFTKGDRKSYLNYSIIHGGGVNLLGNLNSYTYLNTYSPSKIYEAYNQWLGQPIIKFKRISNRSLFTRAGIVSSSNQWQLLNHQVEIPTFISDDGITGKADSCTIMLFFGENNSYLDDGSGLYTGAIQYLYPFLTLN